MPPVPAKPSLDTVRSFSPLNGLREDSLRQVYARIGLKTLPVNKELFRLGSRNSTAFFLVSGTLELRDADNKVIRELVGGTPESLHRIAHQVPRRVTARAKTEVGYFEVDDNLLDVMLTWDQTGSFEVGELGGGQAEEMAEGDWMSALLLFDLLQRIPPANLQALFMRMERVEVDAGQTIVEQDADGDFFYVMTAGRALVTRKSGAHAKPVKLAELGPGSCFGEEALIANERRNATVQMLSGGVVHRLAKEDFNALLSDSLTRYFSREDADAAVSSGQAQWLDVRLPSEFRHGAIAGALNVPLIMLRARISALDPNKRYICYCDSQRRSSVAAFILQQAGIPSGVLRGGFHPSSG